MADDAGPFRLHAVLRRHLHHGVVIAVMLLTGPHTNRLPSGPALAVVCAAAGLAGSLAAGRRAARMERHGLDGLDPHRWTAAAPVALVLGLGWHGERLWPIVCAAAFVLGVAAGEVGSKRLRRSGAAAGCAASGP